MHKVSRKEGDYIVITCADKKITIRLDAIEGKQANISVGAPEEVDVIFGELLYGEYFETD